MFSASPVYTYTDTQIDTELPISLSLPKCSLLLSGESKTNAKQKILNSSKLLLRISLHVEQLPLSMHVCETQQKFGDVITSLINSQRASNVLTYNQKN